MKKFLIYLLALAALAGMYGCGKAGESTTAVEEETVILPGGGTGKVYAIMKSEDDAATTAILNAAGAAIEEKGYILKVAYHGGDGAKQAELLDKSVEKKAEAILCQVADASSLSGNIASATEAGIPVFLIGQKETGTEGAAAIVSMNLEKGAEEAAAALLEKTGEGGSIAFFSAEEGDILAAKCEEGLKKALEGTSSTLAASQAIGTEMEEGKKAVSSILNGTTGINGIFCAGDEAAKIAVQAVKEAKLEEQIAIVNVGGSNRVRNLVKKEKLLASYVLPAAEAGKILGEQVASYLSKGKMTERNLMAEGFLMTKDNAANVDDFQLK